MKSLPDGRVIGIGYLIAKMNRRRVKPKPAKPYPRTIDIEQFPDTLLYFWATKHANGTSCKELGHAYGMNGHQMRFAIGAWHKKNRQTQQKLGKIGGK
jgi:hypothetical protein